MVPMMINQNENENENDFVLGGFWGVGDGDLGVLSGGWVCNAASMPKPLRVSVI